MMASSVEQGVVEDPNVDSPSIGCMVRAGNSCYYSVILYANIPFFLPVQKAVTNQDQLEVSDEELETIHFMLNKTVEGYTYGMVQVLYTRLVFL